MYYYIESDRVVLANDKLTSCASVLWAVAE